MGKKSRPKPPKAPDVSEMINAQTQNNRVDTHNPYGSQEFIKSPDGSWQSHVNFTPEMQALFSRQKEMAGAAPSSYQSQGMGGELRERLDAKLGRGEPAQHNIQSYGDVEMPAPEIQPESMSQPQPMRPSPFSGGGPRGNGAIQRSGLMDAMRGVRR